MLARRADLIDGMGGCQRTFGSVVADQRGHAAGVTQKGPRHKCFFRSLFFCDNSLRYVRALPFERSLATS